MNSSINSESLYTHFTKGEMSNEICRQSKKYKKEKKYIKHL